MDIRAWRWKAQIQEGMGKLLRTVDRWHPSGRRPGLIVNEEFWKKANRMIILYQSANWEQMRDFYEHDAVMRSMAASRKTPWFVAR